MAEPAPPKVPSGAARAVLSPPPGAPPSVPTQGAEVARSSLNTSAFVHSESVCGRDLTSPPLYNIPAWLRYLACSFREIGCFEVVDNTAFLELVRYAKSKGFPVQLGGAPLGELAVRQFEGARREGKWHDFLWGKTEGLFDSISFDYADSGLQTPLGRADRLKSLPFDLVSARDVSPITVPAVVTYVDIGRETGRIVILDTITNGILFEERFDLDDTSPEDMLKKARHFVDYKRIRREFDESRPLFPEDVSRLEAHAVYKFKDSATPEEVLQVRAEWEVAPSLLENVNFSVPAPYFEENLHRDASGIYTRISPEEMKGNGYRPIIIRSGGRRFMAEIRSEGFSIADPVSPYFADSPNEPPYRPVVVDLSAIGGGEIAHTFYQEAFRPVDTVGGYKVYVDDSVRLSKYRDEIGEMAGGISSAELAFGERPGAVVKRFYIPDVLPAELAASVDADEYDTIVFHDETFIFPDMSIWRIGQHEAFHSIDFKYRLSDDPEFKNWFESKVKGGIGNSLGEVPKTGFYKLFLENEREFFAYLLGSLYLPPPRLARELGAMPHKARTFYFKSLKRLRTLIARKVSPGLPIIRKIDRVVWETRNLQ